MSGGFFGNYFRRKRTEETSSPGAGAPDAPANAPADTPADTPAGAPAAAARSEHALKQQVLADPVLAALLEEGAVEMGRVLAAARGWDEERGGLWRCLLPDGGPEREAILALAADALGIEAVEVAADAPSDGVLALVQSFFPPAVWTAFRKLEVLPWTFGMDPVTMQPRLVIAAADPTGPKVQDFTAALKLSVESRYAPAAAIRRRLGLSAADDAPHARPAPAERASAERASAEHASAEHASAESRRAVGGAPTDARPVRPATGETSARRHPAPSSDADVALEDGVEPAAPGLVDPGSIGGDGQVGADPAGGAPSSGAPPFDASEPEGPPSPPRPAEDVPNLDVVKSRDRVVAMLLRKEVVTPAQVREAQLRQERQEHKETLWRTLATVGEVNREAVYAEAARVYAFPFAKLAEVKPDPEFARSVMDTFPEEYRDDLIRFRVLPFECDLEQQTGAIKLVFVTHDPTRPELHRLMQRLKLERFELRYAPEALVAAALAEAFPRKNEYLERMQEGEGAFDLGMNYDEGADLIDEDALEAEISRSTLINLFEATLVESVRQGASDIHIYPNADKKIEIHFRVDGRLSLWHTEKKVHPEALLAVIKDNATNVDRFERDAAQDGFIQRWIDDALIRFRVSVLPIANASQEIRSESIVIRVLDDRKVITDLRKLGLLDTAMERFANAIRQPHGMVILTGPTGSGKSTTLVAALHQTVTPEVNVLTVEDPVEYIIPGVRQIKLNHKLGLEGALRSILRHDPDVVMVGEMRDRDTAELAIKLANTGHLTFSTLHTNDAPAAISRLYKMGIEPFLIAYAINLVVAQRLIRKLCPACKVVDDDPDPVMLSRLGFSDLEIETTTIYRKGDDSDCPTCKGVGYKGRRAVAEALHFSRAIRHLIVEADRMIDEERIRKQAVTEGMLTLQDSAREIVKQGETDIREMIRVVMTEH